MENLEAHKKNLLKRLQAVYAFGNEIKKGDLPYSLQNYPNYYRSLFELLDYFEQLPISIRNYFSEGKAGFFGSDFLAEEQGYFQNLKVGIEWKKSQDYLFTKILNSLKPRLEEKKLIPPVHWVDLLVHYLHKHDSTTFIYSSFQVDYKMVLDYSKILTREVNQELEEIEISKADDIYTVNKYLLIQYIISGKINYNSLSSGTQEYLMSKILSKTTKQIRNYKLVEANGFRENQNKAKTELHNILKNLK